MISKVYIGCNMKNRLETSVDVGRLKFLGGDGFRLFFCNNTGKRPW